MWVQLCVNCDTVFARATKTNWCCPCNRNNMLVISPYWTGIQHNSRSIIMNTWGCHTKCRVVYHSGQKKDQSHISLINQSLISDPPGSCDVAIAPIHANSTIPREFSATLQFQHITATFPQISQIIVVTQLDRK